MRRIGTKYILPPFDFQNVDCRCADKTDTWLKIKILLAAVVIETFKYDQKLGMTLNLFMSNDN